jgi:simple sugar transport system permease protein
MVAGRGFLAVAAVILGRWHPLGALAAAAFFGFAETLAQRLELAYGSLSSVSELYKMIPFILTIAVLVAGGRRTRAPGGLGTITEPE